MIRQIKADLPSVSALTLRQLGIGIRPYGIVEKRAKLPGAIAGEVRAGPEQRQ